MNIDGKTIWHQTSGDTDRDYGNICLKWDVTLKGPGAVGKWPDCADSLHRPSQELYDLECFCEKIKPGDLVILRIGREHVYGVGEIVGEYEWLPEFSDVDGLDLQHTRRVRWLWKAENSPKEFKANSLMYGDTVQKLNPQSPVIEWLRELEIPEANYQRPIVQIPKLKKIELTTIEEIVKYLTDKGVVSNSIKNLRDKFDEFTIIAKWYAEFGKPSEPRTFFHLIIPLFRVLGWTPQKMEFEWNEVDLALFDRLPRHDDNLAVVVESKKQWESCLSVISRAQSYAEGKANCKRLIVSDGIRYGIYFLRQNTIQLYAYMNLTDLRDEYPVYNCFGAKEALHAMTPEWNET